MDAVGLRLFFFSSRRRHTRFDCDWSSDVCSSDLSPQMIVSRVILRFDCQGERFDGAQVKRSNFLGVLLLRLRVLLLRSEEHTSELQSQSNLVCRLLLEKKKVHTLRLQQLISHLTV